MSHDTSRDVRRDDGEHLGRAVFDHGRWRAETIFGSALSGSVDNVEEAEELVRREGLSSLIDPWWFRGDGGEWNRGWIVEVRPDRVKVSWTDPKYFMASPEWFEVADDNIRREQPAISP